MKGIAGTRIELDEHTGDLADKVLRDGQEDAALQVNEGMMSFYAI